MSVIGNLAGAFKGSSLAGRKVLTKSLDQYKALMRKQPENQRLIDYFKANIGKVKSTEELVRNPRLMQVALGAFGLEDQASAKAFIKKILDENLNNEKSLARRLVDPRYREIAESFGIATNGLANLSDPAWVDGIAERFVTNEFEKAVGEGSEALRLALYFERKAPTITNWFQVLGDKALNQVARKAVGLPDSSSQIELGRQVKLFNEKFNIRDFEEPEKVAKLVTKFLARADAEQTADSPLLQLIQGRGRARPTGFAPILSIDPTLF